MGKPRHGCEPLHLRRDCRSNKRHKEIRRNQRFETYKRVSTERNKWEPQGRKISPTLKTDREGERQCAMEGIGGIYGEAGTLRGHHRTGERNEGGAGESMGPVLHSQKGIVD